MNITLDTLGSYLQTLYWCGWIEKAENPDDRGYLYRSIGGRHNG